MDGIQAYNGAFCSTRARVVPAPARPRSRSTRPPSRRPRTTCRRCGAGSGWCWPSPCRWRSRRSIMVLRLPPVYLAKAEIEINASGARPGALDAGVARPRPARSVEPGELRPQPRSQAARASGSPSRSSATPASRPELSQYDDPAFELFKTLNVQQVKKTNSFIVTLEGNDPARTKKLLEMLLNEFQKQAKAENEDKTRGDRRVRRAKPRRSSRTSSKKLDEDHRDGTAENPHDRPRRPKHPRRAICEPGIDHVAEATAAGRHSSADADRPDVPQVRVGSRGHARERRGSRSSRRETQVPAQLSSTCKGTVRNFNSDPAAIEAGQGARRRAGRARRAAVDQARSGREPDRDDPGAVPAASSRPTRSSTTSCWPRCRSRCPSTRRSWPCSEDREEKAEADRADGREADGVRDPVDSRW